MSEDVTKNNKNFDLLFIKPEEESEKIDELIYDMLEISDGTLKDIEKVKRDVKIIYGFENDYFSYRILDNLIHQLTNMSRKEAKESIIRKIKLLDIVKNVKFDGNNYKIETNEGKIEFSPVGFINDIEVEINPILAPNDTIIRQSLKNGDWRIHLKEISNIKTRMGHCHPFAVDTSRMLRDYFGIENEVVTGYTYYATEKSKYLHSWNEFKTDDGKENVLDSTLNAIMNKEGYYLLRHVDVISKVDSRQISEDQKKYSEFLDDIDLKTYLTCRDEIVKDLENKKQLFQKDEGEER